MEKNISYLNRNFEDCKQAFIEFSKQYYPDLEINYDDASIASWMIDIAAGAVDDLSYHTDRVFQETNINSANETASLYALARNNGLKIPGPKGAMCEVMFSCKVPMSGNGPDSSKYPIIKMGTKVAAGSQVFELLEDIDFSKQFNNSGLPDRTIVPILNSNGLVTHYKICKLAVVVAGESKIYKKAVYNSDIKPFMEVLIPVKNVMNVESVIVQNGTDILSMPGYAAFYSKSEEVCTGNNQTTRFFEVDSLAQQFRWDDKMSSDGLSAVTETYSQSGVSICVVTKGEWKPLRHKFITEYTDKGYLKVIFGAGEDATSDNDMGNTASEFSKFLISRAIKNDSLGYLPKANSSIFILYRVGGGKVSNVAKGAINTIVALNAENCSDNDIKNSIKVESTMPSVSGKDMPTPDELRYLIKYNNGSQNRCVTVKDYINRIHLLPPKYGTPFRVSGAEGNNKIMLYLLGLDYLGHLDATLPVTLIKNIRDYLTEYRMINDYVEIKSGKIINISFDADICVDRTYNKADVIGNVIQTIEQYMDVRRHNMGDDIFVGDIKKEISKVDGVINLIDLKIWNEFGEGYSSTQTSQEIVTDNECVSKGIEARANAFLIDLEASEDVLYSEGDTMLEIKYPETDIRIRCKIR